MENLEESFIGAFSRGKVRVIVKPSSKSNEIVGFDHEAETYKISIRAAPEKGKANKELVKFVSKIVKKRVEIASGFTAKTKVLRALE
jgi:uncharacterized protein (TIGR00251 family)